MPEEDERKREKSNSSNKELQEDKNAGSETTFGSAYGDSFGGQIPGKDTTFYYRCPKDDCIYQCMESTREPDSPPECPDHDKVMREVKEDECR